MRNSLSRMLMCGIEERFALMRVALGLEPADMAILNASMVNVYTGELLENCPVAVKGKWIAAVAPVSIRNGYRSKAIVDTGLMVLIQEDKDTATEPVQDLGCDHARRFETTRGHALFPRRRRGRI